MIFLPSHYHTLSPPAGEGGEGGDGGDDGGGDHPQPPPPPPQLSRQTETQTETQLLRSGSNRAVSFFLPGCQPGVL